MIGLEIKKTSREIGNRADQQAVAGIAAVESRIVGGGKKKEKEKEKEKEKVLRLRMRNGIQFIKS
jgi:hypothetical protein